MSAMVARLLLVLLFVLPLGTEMKPETGSFPLSMQTQVGASNTCSQPKGQRNSLMREAEKHKHTVSRVEFIGNVHINDYTLRRQILLNEGDLFTRRNVLRTIEHLNRLKAINPVTLSDFEIRLRKEEKTVDVLICFHER